MGWATEKNPEDRCGKGEKEKDTDRNSSERRWEAKTKGRNSLL